MSDKELRKKIRATLKRYPGLCSQALHAQVMHETGERDEFRLRGILCHMLAQQEVTADEHWSLYDC